MSVPDQRSTYRLAARAARVVLALNLLLFVAKVVTGWLGHSFALFADGLNSLADVVISAALLAGLHLASRPADENHAYGHGKLEQEISRLIAVAVLVTGGGIVWEAVSRLFEAHDPPDRSVLIVAALSMLLKIFLYRFENRVARRLSSSALAADALNHKADIAATASVIVGTAAVWVGGPAWAPADDLAAVVVGVAMIAASALSILDTTSELLDRMPPAEIIERIEMLAVGFPQILGVDKIQGRKVGLHYFIDLHLEVSGDITVSEGHLVGHQVKDWLIAEMAEIGDVVVHIEPGGGSGLGSNTQQ